MRKNYPQNTVEKAFKKAGWNISETQYVVAKQSFLIDNQTEVEAGTFCGFKVVECSAENDVVYANLKLCFFDNGEDETLSCVIDANKNTIAIEDNLFNELFEPCDDETVEAIKTYNKSLKEYFTSKDKYETHLNIASFIIAMSFLLLWVIFAVLELSMAVIIVISVILSLTIGYGLVGYGLMGEYDNTLKGKEQNKAILALFDTIKNKENEYIEKLN